MTRLILMESGLSGNGIEEQLENRSSKGQKRSLSFLTAQRMVKRFLTCDRVTTVEVNCRKYIVQELAEKLIVDSSELELFLKPVSRAFCRRVPEKIALPLIKLYCNTKWAKDGRK